ncbi:pilus assembly protein PilP [Arenimonas oryziterrae]|uniref:Uncharacterized protein n=1 Tax=Arenimonas oryziterrae DSM 21050 = YC6267 TaxID=1121015 RepID=A0A091AQI7_9GAMM|nr:pilus assembly protein PilP [Arenimonas oryziterrae]KFN42423.1 hypothetical protein N789_13790 [Arenimonas oryziterrae DSM 21050 = YC6267]
MVKFSRRLPLRLAPVVLAPVLLAVTASTAVAATEAPAATPKEKLEAFDYFNLVLIGTTAAADGTRLACFQLPDGSRQAAGVNNHLGKNHAYISRVNQSSIEVTELLPVNGGEWAVSRFFWPVSASAPEGEIQCPDNREPADSGIQDVAR